MNTYEIHTASYFHRNTLPSNTLQPQDLWHGMHVKSALLLLLLFISVYSIYKADVVVF